MIINNYGLVWPQQQWNYCWITQYRGGREEHCDDKEGASEAAFIILQKAGGGSSKNGMPGRVCVACMWGRRGRPRVLMCMWMCMFQHLQNVQYNGSAWKDTQEPNGADSHFPHTAHWKSNERLRNGLHIQRLNPMASRGPRAAEVNK